jgi:hypothetical protein|uniref:DUF4321 domain-containing protein n=1 Tax=candidate division WOR-3 bacterium TaxID=2052148 RepID=A0A7C3YRT6_UNCW3
MPLNLSRKLGLTLFIIIVGGIVFGVIGEVIGLIIPESPVKKVILKYIWVGFSPVTINLNIVSFTIGFHIKFNLLSVLGIIFLGYILRWLF